MRASERKLRTADGKIIRDVQRWAKQRAQEKHEALSRGDTNDAAPIGAAALTTGEANGKITGAKQGKYPRKSRHRHETETALDFACTVWTVSVRGTPSGKAAFVRWGGRALTSFVRRGTRGSRAPSIPSSESSPSCRGFATKI